MKKLLLIVDAQYDFLEGGSLPVNGSTEKMNKLVEHIEKNNYDIVVFTADWHPHSHCSFTDNGGQWPMHCVQHTHGASIFQPLLNSAFATSKEVKILTKGDITKKEEYSLMDNFHSSKSFLRLVNRNNIDQIDACGIAGDICLANTISGLIKCGLKDKLNVLTEFSPSLDDGTVLRNLVSENGLKSI